MLNEHRIRSGWGKQKSQAKGDRAMNKSNRVLTRLGARELTVEETEFVAGSQIVHTNVCSFFTTTMTGSGDGDGCTDFVRD